MPLDSSQAGLPFTPTNGSFQIIATNTQTGVSTTNNIPVALLGSGHDTTLNSLAAEINGVSGLSAQVANGTLTISSTGANTQFAFGTDTSGTLAALGINTFFTGSQAGSIGVNSTLLQDPTKFAASTPGSWHGHDERPDSGQLPHAAVGHAKRRNDPDAL